MKDKETSWGAVADWYDETVSKGYSYQKSLILPNIVRLLSPKKGEQVIDVACGQGFFAHEIKRLGGDVVGVDIAPELIALAQKSDPGGDYCVGSAEELTGFPDNSYDAALCILALQNIRDSSRAFAAVARVLKDGGRFIIVLNHPCFRIPRRSGWEFDEKSAIQFRRIDGYLSEAMIEIDMEPGKSGKGEKTISFHRPLQLYFKQLANNGFCVRRLEEWESNKESNVGPRKAAEDRARKEIPLFMAIEAVKED